MVKKLTTLRAGVVMILNPTPKRLTTAPSQWAAAATIQRRLARLAWMSLINSFEAIGIAPF